MAMPFGSALAIYTLFWWMTLFVVLPFRLRRRGAAPDVHVPGQADSAPPQFSVWRTVGWTTAISAVAFTLFYANYAAGWITTDDIDFFSAPDRLR